MSHVNGLSREAFLASRLIQSVSRVMGDHEQVTRMESVMCHTTIVSILPEELIIAVGMLRDVTLSRNAFLSGRSTPSFVMLWCEKQEASYV